MTARSPGDHTSLDQCCSTCGAEGIALAERALAGGTLHGDATGTHCAAALLLAFAGRPELAATQLEEAIADARRHGALVIQQTALALRGSVRLMAGNVVAADLDAHAALALGREEGVRGGHLVWILIDALLAQGRVAEAEAALREHGLTGPIPNQEIQVHLKSSARAALLQRCPSA